jgi:hypothetical protein
MPLALDASPVLLAWKMRLRWARRTSEAIIAVIVRISEVNHPMDEVSLMAAMATVRTMVRTS